MIALMTSGRYTQVGAIVAAFALTFVCPIRWAQAYSAPDVVSPAFDPVSDQELHIPLDEAREALVDQLIQRLGSPNFAEREQASDGLLEIGAAAFSRLRLAYHGTDDFEVRSRIEWVVKSAYLDHHVYSTFGFLGIQQDWTFTPGHEDNPQIPEGHVGINISKVHPATGAERAGLREGDLIIRVDGAPLVGVGRQAVNNFGQIIRERGPGNQLRLLVLRGPSPIEIDATLTRPPPSILRDIPMASLSNRLAHTETRFEIWWSKHFLRPVVPDDSAKPAGQSEQNPPRNSE